MINVSFLVTPAKTTTPLCICLTTTVTTQPSLTESKSKQKCWSRISWAWLIIIIIFTCGLLSSHFGFCALWPFFRYMPIQVTYRKFNYCLLCKINKWSSLNKWCWKNFVKKKKKNFPPPHHLRVEVKKKKKWDNSCNVFFLKWTLTWWLEHLHKRERVWFYLSLKCSNKVCEVGASGRPHTCPKENEIINNWKHLGTSDNKQDFDLY